MKTHYDILIIGGGLIGNTLALALEKSHWRIGLIEEKTPTLHSQARDDMRALALAKKSQEILNALDIWETIAPHATPIEKIHISQQHYFGTSVLDAKEMAFDAFGYVVPLPDLFQTLQHKFSSTKNIDFIRPAKVVDISAKDQHWEVHLDNQPTLSARLLICCDGTHSFARQTLELSTTEHDYQQAALITNITLENPHHNIAYERFTHAGSLAFLPMRDQRATLVWVHDKKDTEKLLHLDDKEFIHQLQKNFGRRAGNFLHSSKRQIHPLQEMLASKQTSTRLILMGNAAHTMHPIAAQGLNLGLRDVMTLADLLNHEANDPGDYLLLQQYEKQRARDQQSTSRLSHALQKLSGQHSKILRGLANIALQSFDLFPGLKKRFALKQMGLIDSLFFI